VHDEVLDPQFRHEAVLNAWYCRVPPRRADADGRVLLCFPWAGGGQAGFKAWRELVSAEMELWLARLPGREDRIREVPSSDAGALISELAAAATAVTDRPYALFGHSFGALLAFWVAVALSGTSGRSPVLVAVSGARPPGSRPLDRPLSIMSDGELVATLLSFGGSDAEVLADPEIQELLLPAIRADVAMAEECNWRNGPVLGCPVAAFAGTGDWLAPPQLMLGWRRWTTAGFRLRVFPGGHMFPALAPDEVVAGLAEELSSALADA